MLSGNRDRSDWVKNLKLDPRVTVQLAGGHFEGRGRVVEETQEDESARCLLVEKYERSPGRLATWRRNALPVAVDLAI